MSRFFGRRIYAMRNRQAFISFTFDDFPVSALVGGGGILKRYGFAGTYYASLGLMGQDSPTGYIFSPKHLAGLLADGHELGCHTFSHCHAWETAPHAFEDSIIENRRTLEKLLPGAFFKTLSYPISVPRPQTKRLLEKHFSCCRGGGQVFNMGRIDLNCLNAFFLEQSRDAPGLVKHMIDRNRDASGWLVFATHDVCSNHSSFGCTETLFEEIVQCAAQSGAKILPVGRVLDEVCSGPEI